MEAENYSQGANSSDIVQIDNTEVNMKIVQSVYNEITGKKEKITQFLEESHVITIEDINQLNTKITQNLEQYNVIEKNCSVTVFHADDCKQQFSTYERFKLYDSSNNSPLINIRLEYNFLIILPNLRTPQNYKIEINLFSGSGLRAKEFSQNSRNRRFIRFLGNAGGQIEIEYIDYTVARNFQTAISQWYQSIDKNKANSLLNKIQEYSEHIPFLFKIMTALVCTYILYHQSKIFNLEDMGLNTILPAIIFYFSIFYVSILLAEKLGSFCEYAIDRYQIPSCLRLNSGDSKAFKQVKKDNKSQLLVILISIISSILINIVSAYLTIKFGIL